MLRGPAAGLKLLGAGGAIAREDELVRARIAGLQVEGDALRARPEELDEARARGAVRLAVGDGHGRHRELRLLRLVLPVARLHHARAG